MSTTPNNSQPIVTSNASYSPIYNISSLSKRPPTSDPEETLNKRLKFSAFKEVEPVALDNDEDLRLETHEIAFWFTHPHTGRIESVWDDEFTFQEQVSLL
jgi:hypothetical protein